MPVRKGFLANHRWQVGLSLVAFVSSVIVFAVGFADLVLIGPLYVGFVIAFMVLSGVWPIHQLLRYRRMMRVVGDEESAATPRSTWALLLGPLLVAIPVVMWTVGSSVALVMEARADYLEVEHREIGGDQVVAVDMQVEAIEWYRGNALLSLTGPTGEAVRILRATCPGDVTICVQPKLDCAADDDSAECTAAPTHGRAITSRNKRFFRMNIFLYHEPGTLADGSYRLDIALSRKGFETVTRTAEFDIGAR